ncbi:MAG: tRNA uridine-5-carboxymethylaminomethyl(34) synthesis GTPase MnmE [Chlamydiota bacterium]
MSYQRSDTIAAIATPPGEGGVSIIRISGSQSRQIADKVFSGDVLSYATHTVHYGRVRDRQGDILDDVLVIVMLGRRSYTGEDTVEIQGHGGGLVTNKILELVISQGARAALPGEFTFRAYMNGKIDLAQAEAVQSLISAQGEIALSAAGKHLQGKLSKNIMEFRQELTSIAGIIEAWIDFPEEGLEFSSCQEVCSQLSSICKQMERLAATFNDGKVLHDGVAVCFLGAPNVGKSSLMNALLGKERAIVTSIPGTTRDIVEDDLRLNGLKIRLTDTAGIREDAQVVEEEGIKRALQAKDEADIIIYVLDITLGVSDKDRQLLSQLPPDRTIIVWNKADLNRLLADGLPFEHSVLLSAKTGDGLPALHAAIDQVIWKGKVPSKQEVILTNARHREALDKAIIAGREVVFGLENDRSPEFVTMDMRCCLEELGKIIGTDVTEDILSSIFSNFCVGK